MDVTIDLKNGQLYGAVLANRDLSGADLGAANLRTANLQGANLQGANLQGAWLQGANLQGANLQGANLQGAFLRGANVQRANFQSGKLSGLQSGSLEREPAQLPSNWSISNGFMIGPKADLTGADLENQDFTGLNLEGVILRNCKLAGAIFERANLSACVSGKIRGEPQSLPTGWMLRNGYLLGPKADLTGASLKDADLSGADLSGATLTRVKSRGISAVSVKLPKHWHLREGRLLGPGVDLSSSDLSGQDLSHLDLSQAYLSGTKFSATTNLENTRLVGCTGKPAPTPPGWRYVSQALFAPGVNVSDSDFSKADLSDLNLERANFTNCRLRGTNFSGSNLRSANLSQADLRAKRNETQDFLRKGLGELGAVGKIVNHFMTTEKIRDFIPHDAVKGIWEVTGADLTGADLTGADLTGAKLDGAVVARAIFQEVDLATVDAKDLNGTPLALPTGWSLIGERFVRVHYGGENQDPKLSSANLAEQLVKLGDLHKEGLLSDAEFAQAKSKLLGQTSN